MTNFDDFMNVVCDKCQKTYRSFRETRPLICPVCRFVDDALAEVKVSCGQFQFASHWLWCLPDAAERFEARGWIIDLQVPSRSDAYIGHLIMTIKAKDVSRCKGKPGMPCRCYTSTKCGALPSPADVHAVKQRVCRESCPVAPLPSRTQSIDALTQRCCEALSTYTVDPVVVKLTFDDMPALIGAVRKLRASGWTCSITAGGECLYRPGLITISPKQ